MNLTADLLESFAGVFLSPRYDQPQPTPEFHREAWRLYCSPMKQCAIAAPRNHAKSTALTHDYILAIALFREEDYIILVGSSEEMAIEHLGDIANELHENEDLQAEFGIKGFLTDAKTDIVVECADGYQFRIIARGAEQKIRGRKWRGKRPGLLVCDDIEDDEQVENKDRRRKFSRWFFRAAKQALRDGGKIRVHGTVLHDDSLLNNLLQHGQWRGLRKRAHASFNDFSSILWPEKFPEARLRNIRQEFIESSDAAGYAQEYLNDPLDSSEAFLRRDDFIEMSDADREAEKVLCVAADFAVSKADMANRTSFTVGGKCPQNLIHFIDQRVGRWDTREWIDVMFEIQERYDPAYFFVEDGVIWKAISRMVQLEMQERNIWLNIVPVPSLKDKATRARPLQKRMRSGGTRWDKDATWYAEMEWEMLRFTGTAQSTLDDQFDSAALLVKGLDVAMPQAEREDFMDDAELEFEQHSAASRGAQGRSAVTGY